MLITRKLIFRFGVYTAGFVLVTEVGGGNHGRMAAHTGGSLYIIHQSLILVWDQKYLGWVIQVKGLLKRVKMIFLKTLLGLTSKIFFFSVSWGNMADITTAGGKEVQTRILAFWREIKDEKTDILL
ncbi:hypothetical protein R6Q59_016630 [Mikania micrantha]